MLGFGEDYDFSRLGWAVLFLVGLTLLSYGCWLAWHPAGFMVAGLVIAVIGFGGGLEVDKRQGTR